MRRKPALSQQNRFLLDRVRQYRELERLLKVLANPIRLAVVELLRGKERGLTVSEMCEILHVRQAVMSAYLKKLVRAGVLGCVRQGRHAYYFIKNEHVLDIMDCLNRCIRR